MVEPVEELERAYPLLDAALDWMHKNRAGKTYAWYRDHLNSFAKSIGPKLLVSELITNSVKYGGEGALRLQIETEGARKLRAEVIDQGVGFVPTARDRPATEVGGWGLHLVQTLSNRWGVHEGSTHVWFEIDR